MRSGRLVRLLFAALAVAVGVGGCTSRTGPGDYGWRLDRMERAVPIVHRVGDERQVDGECGLDVDHPPARERRYRPVGGTTVLEAERAIYDYFLAHGFDDDGGLLSSPEDMDQDWSLVGPGGMWLHGSHTDPDTREGVDLITVSMESSTAC